MEGAATVSKVCRCHCAPYMYLCCFTHHSSGLLMFWLIVVGDIFSLLNRNNKENLGFVKSYEPRKEEVRHLRILLYGPVGAGKSSFINSVDSVLQGRITDQAATDATSWSSFTKKYKTYKISKNSEHCYSFVFNDIMGFENKSDRGVNAEDMKLVLRGHVAEGYEFTPGKLLKEGDQGYNSCPTLEDRVHVLVCVVPVDSMSLFSDKVVKKMRDVRLAASELGIPQLAILTKVDNSCIKTKRNIKNIYWSKYLKEKADEFHTLLGLPLKCIFLVKNYESEDKTNADIDAPILCALRQMITLGEDFLNNL